MRSLSLLTAMLITLLAPTVADAKKPKKAPPAPLPTPIPLPAASNPAEALSPYIINLQQLLSFERPDYTASQPLFTQTAGLLLTLRQALVVEQEKAEAKQKRMYTAAINTSDLITAAINDRDTALGDLKSSQAVAAGRKLENPARKDNLAQGIGGGGIAKAQAVAVERDREKQFLRQSARDRRDDQNAMSTMAINHWNQRAAEWRQKIAAAYSQIK